MMRIFGFNGSDTFWTVVQLILAVAYATWCALMAYTLVATHFPNPTTEQVITVAFIVMITHVDLKPSKKGD